jgi:hypothetical protein
MVRFHKYLTDEQFEKLPSGEQMEYRFCTHCRFYIHVTEIKTHLCDPIDPRD